MATHETMIAAAKRAARRRTRESADTYQQALDAVAQNAGRANWGAFLRDPCRIRDEAENATVNAEGSPNTATTMATIDMETAPAKGASVDGPTPKKRHSTPKRLLIVGTTAVLMAGVGYVTHGPSISQVGSQLDWERKVLPSSSFETLVRDNPRLMRPTPDRHVFAVRGLPRNRRDLMIVFMDARPVDMKLGRWIRIQYDRLILDNPYFNAMDNAYPQGELLNHPVVRWRGVLDCNSGVWMRRRDIEIADSPMGATVSTWNGTVTPSRGRTKLLQFTPRELATLCSAEALEASKRVDADPIQIPGVWSTD